MAEQGWTIEERTQGVAAVMPDAFSSGMWAVIAHDLDPHCRSPAGAGACSALSGMLMRFWAAHEASERFLDLFATPGADSDLKIRCQQEAAHFGFFTNVVSTVECCYFCFFWIGVMLKKPGFSDEHPGDLRLHPEKITEMFERAFPSDRLARAMREVVEDEHWKSAKETRDAMSHRGALPRYIDSNWKEPVPALYAPIFVTRKPKDHPKDWGPTDHPLQTAIAVHAWLVGATTKLLMWGSQFVHRELGPAELAPED